MGGARDIPRALVRAAKSTKHNVIKAASPPHSVPLGIFGCTGIGMQTLISRPRSLALIPLLFGRNTSYNRGSPSPWLVGGIEPVGCLPYRMH